MNNARLIIKLTCNNTAVKYKKHMHGNQFAIKISSSSLPYEIKDCCTIYYGCSIESTGHSSGLGDYLRNHKI